MGFFVAVVDMSTSPLGGTLSLEDLVSVEEKS
jgi:hypothetical protein